MVEQHNQHIDKLVELTHKAFNAQSPLFVLVHYDRKADSEQFINKLSQQLKTSIYHPQQQPNNDELYAAFEADREQQTLSLVCDKDYDGSNAPNHVGFINYLNFNSDRMFQDKLHLVLFVPTNELATFIGLATDLAKLRQQTFYLQHKTAIYQFNWLDTDDVRQSLTSQQDTDPQVIDKHIQYAREQLNQLSDYDAQVEVYLNLSQWLMEHQAVTQAQEIITEAIHRSDANEDTAQLKATLANITYRLENYPQAIEYYRQSLAIHHLRGNKTQEIDIHRCIATIYDKNDDSQSGLRHLKLALMISNELNDMPLQSQINQQMAHIYHSKKEINKALYYLKQSLVMSQQLNDQAAQATTLNDIAKVYYFKNAQEAALDFLNQSQAVLAQLQDRAGECAVLHNIAAINQGKNDIDAALSYLKLALVKAQEVGAHSYAQSFSTNIAQLYQDKGIEMTPGEDATTARFGVSPQDFKPG